MAARTWIADITKNWSDVTAWDGGVAVPVTTDTITFNATHVGNCTADAFGTWSGGTVTITGYTGVITKSAGVAMTTAAWSQSSGTFAQGTGTFTTGGNTFTMTGGTFQHNNTGSFTCGAFAVSAGTFTNSGASSFTSTTFALTGTGIFTGVIAQTMTTTSVTFSGTASLTPNNIWALNGSWTQSGATTTFTNNSGTITIGANCTFNDTRSVFNKIVVNAAGSTIVQSVGTTWPLGATPSTATGAGSLTLNGITTWSGTWTNGSGNVSTGSSSTLTGTSTPQINMNYNLTIDPGTTITNPIATISFTSSTDSTLTDTGDKLSGTTYSISKSANFTVAANTICRLGANATSTVSTFTFTINGTVNVGGTWTNTGNVTISSTGTITGGVSTLVLNNGSWNASSGAATIPVNFNITFNITAGSGSLFFTGAGKSYGTIRRTNSNGANLTFADSNTIASIRDDDGLVAHILIFAAGTTTVVGAWSVKGVSGAAVTLNSSVSGTVATIQSSSGLPFESDWLVIKDISVDLTPGWFAGWNSVTSVGSVGLNWKMKSLTHEIWDIQGQYKTTLGSFGQILNPIRLSTSQGGGGATGIVLDAGASSLDNFYNDCWVTVVSGTGVGQARFISGYTGSSRLASVSPNWVTNPDATSVFIIESAGRVDLGEWLGTAPNALISGRVDASPVIRSGTAQAGAAGTIDLDAGASATADIYDDCVVAIVSGDGAGQARIIQQYVGGVNRRCNVVPDFVTNPSSNSVFVILPKGRSNVGLWRASEPNPLIVKRVDVTAGAVQAGAINAAAINADTYTYQMKATLDRDSVNTTDRYSVAFFKNGQPVTSGITVPTIQVIKQTDGSDLVATTALTQVAATGLYRYTEGTNRIALGAAYYVIVTATIDGSSRTWNQPISRDS